MKYLIISLLSAILLMSCNKTDSSIKMSEKELTELKVNVVKNGSVPSYVKLVYYYEKSSEYFEILPYTLVMSNQYNYDNGSSTILETILKLNNDGQFDLKEINKLNDGDKRFAVYYLNKDADSGNPTAVETLSDLYKNGWGVNMDLKKADSLSIVHDNMMWGR